ncbi:TM0106 family RecB-like putative nuclease [Chroococcidiopsis sp. TS-821]|uniref:TM0106 family RecB-like putative nuclease n=2 Tax=Chroococcidiopsis sp. TS-821 TaxID=1378066 RepID=UPI000D4CCDF3|nr:recombinase B [Chroococcidiopsis sp. TS-821]
MLMTAELLLQYQRCQRRAFLDTHGDRSQRDSPSEFLLRLQQDKIIHQQNALAQQNHQQPNYHQGNWEAGAIATLELMQQGVERISQGILLTTYQEKYTLISRPDLLIKQPGNSLFGDWVYIPAQIELGKRPKLEYQIIAAYNAHVLEQIQGIAPKTAWLFLRRPEVYSVDVARWTSQMQRSLDRCLEILEAELAPEVFISRQRCSLCRWYSQCYAIAKEQQHLSLIPGVTPNRYTQLQALNVVTLESLTQVNPTQLESLPGFDRQVAQKLVLQAQAVFENRPILLNATRTTDVSPAPIELYFDIEAEPDLNLDYLLGVLVVDRQTGTETFHKFLAETPAQEEAIWQQFLDLVCQYPTAPIYHFCAYEVDTVKRLGKLYHTPRSQIKTLLARFVDVYEQVVQTVALPVENYTLKAIARWLGFEWRDPQANGSHCIYWYDRWLATGDRALLDAIVRYNEDDCHATRHVKDWLLAFTNSSSSANLQVVETP